MRSSIVPAKEVPIYFVALFPVLNLDSGRGKSDPPGVFLHGWSADRNNGGDNRVVCFFVASRAGFVSP